MVGEGTSSSGGGANGSRQNTPCVPTPSPAAASVRQRGEGQENDGQDVFVGDDEVFLRPADPPSDPRRGPYARNTLSKRVRMTVTAADKDGVVELMVTPERALYRGSHPADCNTAESLAVSCSTGHRSTGRASQQDGVQNAIAASAKSLAYGGADTDLASEMDTEAEEAAMRIPLLSNREPGEPGNTVPRPPSAVKKVVVAPQVEDERWKTYTRKPVGESDVRCSKCGKWHKCVTHSPGLPAAIGGMEASVPRRTSAGALADADEQEEDKGARRKSLQPNEPHYVDERLAALAALAVVNDSIFAPRGTSAVAKMLDRPQRVHMYDGEAAVNNNGPDRNSSRQMHQHLPLAEFASNPSTDADGVSAATNGIPSDHQSSMYWDGYDMRQNGRAIDSDV